MEDLFRAHGHNPTHFEDPAASTMKRQRESRVLNLQQRQSIRLLVVSHVQSDQARATEKGPWELVSRTASTTEGVDSCVGTGLHLHSGRCAVAVACRKLMGAGLEAVVVIEESGVVD